MNFRNAQGGEVMDIRTKIRKYLEQQGISNAWLAKKTGLSSAALSTMFNLKRELKADEYFKICSALNVPINQFAN